jgi:DNA-binding IclR family transcriptional regulator
MPSKESLLRNSPARNGGLERDLEIIELIAAASPTPLRNNEIAIKSGRDKSQTSRAVSRLLDTGMLIRQGQGVIVGPRLYAMARFTFEAQLVSSSRGEMHGLVHSLGETIHLTVLQGLNVVTIHSESPAHGFRALSWMGVTAPSYMTSSGRVLLSGLDDAQLTRLYPLDEDIAGAPPLCLTRNGRQLLEVVQGIRRAGYSTVNEEYEPGLVGTSVPIYDFSGSIIAAINVAAPKARFEKDLDSAAAHMRAASERITQSLTQY